MPRQADNAGKRGRLREERAHQILTAAAAIFARKGYQRATTREIAAEAGVAEGTIYNYFNNKRDLLIAMSSHLALDSLQELDSLPPQEDVRAYVTALVTDRFESVIIRNLDLIRALVPELLVDDDLRQEYMDKVLSPAVSHLADYISDRMKADAFRKVEPGIVARAMIGVVMSFGLLWLQTGVQLDKKSQEKLVSEVVGLFLDGLRARPDQRKAQGS